MKRWFPVNSCSKFRFLTESSRLLWICNTLLLTYNYSLLTCSKENVHLVLYSGFLCSFYKICCSWQQASLLVDECGVSSLCPEMAAQGPFSLSIFPQRLLPSKRWPEQMHHKPRGLTHTPTRALILFFNFTSGGWFGQLRLWSLSKGGTWSFTCWACMLNHVNTKIGLDVTTLC